MTSLHVLQAIELVLLIYWKIARSRLQTREVGCSGVKQINVLVLSKIEIPVLVSSIVQPLIVRSARPNKLFIIELGNMYDGNSMYSLLVWIHSIPLPVELIIAPFAVFT